jgi:hypothetical protein
MQVKKKDGETFELKIVRQDGCDGEISCMYQVEGIKGSTKAALDFQDYVPDFLPVKFKHQQSEQIVEIKLVNQDIDNYVKKTED